jgi:hypothetical protein
MTMLHEKCKNVHIVLYINDIQKFIFFKRDYLKIYISDYEVYMKSELKVII